MDETTDFNGEINLFKLNFDGSKLIYEYDAIPEDEKQEDFVKRGNEYFSLKKVIGHRVTEFLPSQIHKLIENAFKTALNNNFYELNGRYVAYKRDDKIPHMKSNDTLFSIYKGFEYRFVPFKENMFLCIDYKLIIKFNVSLQHLFNLNVSKSLLVGNSVEIKKSNRKNSNGVLVDIDSNFCKIDFHEFGTESINTSDVYILCRP
ncbi:MAG TPA: hypothetical protein PKC27_06045, partial [Methanomethylovorans sp.]|nr:hypothetical protein [Methanomethylovorans sp.]